MPCAYGGLCALKRCPMEVNFTIKSHTFDSQRCWWETAVHLHGHQLTSITLDVPCGMSQTSGVIRYIPRCSGGHMMSPIARLHVLMSMNVSFTDVTDCKALKCLNWFKARIA